MAFDAQTAPLAARSTTKRTGPDARRGQGVRARPPTRAAVRRRFDEAALAAAIRELRTQRRRAGVPG